MAIRHRRKLLAIAVALGAGTLFQALPHGCAQYYTAAALSAFNVCAVFNCTGGTYFNLCSPYALFLDCPNAVPVTGTTGTTGTTTTT